MTKIISALAILAALSGCVSTSELGEYDRMEGHGYDALRSMQQSVRPSIHMID